MTQHRRRRHLLNLWNRRARAKRERELQLAEQRQAAEHRAAVRRILEQPTQLTPNIDPMRLQRAPLLTPLQAARSKRAER